MKAKRIKLEFLDPNSLTPYGRNAKAHPGDQIQKIAHQISEFGFDQPIVIDDAGVIIKGHGRREAAIQLGMTEVPCIRSSIEEYQAMAARIGDNKVAESSWENEFLKFDFGALERNGVDLALTGFEPDEIDLINDGWQSDIEQMEKTPGHTRGINGQIKVTCAPDQTQELKEYLIEAVRQTGFDGVEVS